MDEKRRITQPWKTVEKQRKTFTAASANHEKCNEFAVTVLKRVQSDSENEAKLCDWLNFSESL